VSEDFIAENAASFASLRALVDRLSDEDLNRPLGDGWTVAAALAHLAFWDQRAVTLSAHPERLPAVSRLSSEEIDSINEAVHALCLAIPPRAAAYLSLASAEAADRAMAALSPESIEGVKAAGMPFNLSRALHRRDHIEQIERRLAR
jgi:hypothetical protein